MKKNRFIFALVSIVVLSGGLLAQTPGYMGKRLVAGYGFYFSPALFGSNGQGSTFFGRGQGNGSDGELAFNVLHEAYVEYALAKRFALGFSAKFYKTSYDNHKLASVNVPYQGTNINYYGYPDGLYYIKGQNYALYGKLFNRNYIAPWGRYMMFGVNIQRFTCTYNPAEMQLRYTSYSYDNYPPVSDFGPPEQTFTRFDVLFGFGRTRVIFNRIMLDYGFNVNMFALANTLFDNVSADDGIFNQRNSSNYQYMENTAPWRVRGVNRFNAFLRVGVLLF